MDYETAAKIVEECCGGCRTASDETVKACAVVDSEIERLRAAMAWLGQHLAGGENKRFYREHPEWHSVAAGQEWFEYTKWCILG
jgi:hypothetical protein